MSTGGTSGHGSSEAASDTDLTSETEGLRSRVSKDSGMAKVSEKIQEHEKQDATHNQEYRIVSTVTVRDTSTPQVGAVITDLAPGTIVNVVEIVDVNQVTRARIDRPVEGWISLKVASGDVLAKKGAEGACCWICYDEDDVENLISPCACKGTQAMVHSSCLLEWVKVKSKNLGRGTSLKCDICKEPYIVSRSRLTWIQMMKIFGYGVSMLIFLMLMAAQVYTKAQKITWMKSSLGENWYSTLLTGPLVIYNVCKVGARLWQGMNIALQNVNGVNNERVQEVHSRSARQSSGSSPDASKEN